MHSQDYIELDTSKASTAEGVSRDADYYYAEPVAAGRGPPWAAAAPAARLGLARPRRLSPALVRRPRGASPAEEAVLERGAPHSAPQVEKARDPARTAAYVVGALMIIHFLHDILKVALDRDRANAFTEANSPGFELRCARVSPMSHFSEVCRSLMECRDTSWVAKVGLAWPRYVLTEALRENMSQTRQFIEYFMHYNIILFCFIGAGAIAFALWSARRSFDSATRGEDPVMRRIL
jgi:hypothetical protein